MSSETPTTGEGLSSDDYANELFDRIEKNIAEEMEKERVQRVEREAEAERQRQAEAESSQRREARREAQLKEQDELKKRAEAIRLKETFLYGTFAPTVAKAAIDAGIPPETSIAKAHQSLTDRWRQSRMQSDGGLYVPTFEPHLTKTRAEAWALSRAYRQEKYSNPRTIAANYIGDVTLDYSGTKHRWSGIVMFTSGVLKDFKWSIRHYDGYSGPDDTSFLPPGVVYEQALKETARLQPSGDISSMAVDNANQALELNEEALGRFVAVHGLTEVVKLSLAD